MSKKAERGTKRTCQNEECGARFYDLNRNPIACPICGSTYELAAPVLEEIETVAEEKARRPVKAPVPEPAEGIAPAEGEAAEVSTDDLADIEAGEEAVVADEAETFLEEEEEGEGDVTGIIGGVTETDEEP